MRLVLFIVFFFSCVESFAQCTITWIRDTSGLERSVDGDFKFSTRSIVKITEQTKTKDNIAGPDQFLLSISLLDSLAYATDTQHPPFYTKIRDSAKWRSHDPDVRSYIDTINLPTIDDNGDILWTGDFKLFNMLPRQIVHYEKQKYFVANDSFVVHQFAYCDSGWSGMRIILKIIFFTQRNLVLLKRKLPEV